MGPWFLMLEKMEEESSTEESCFLSILSMDIAYDDSIAGDFVESHGGIGPADRCPEAG